MNKQKIGWLLVIVGALNWGLIGFGNLLGLGNLNLVALLTGGSSTLENIVYLLVGIGAIIRIPSWKSLS